MFRRIHLLSRWQNSLKILKIVTIVSPAMFIFLLELARNVFFKDAPLAIWGTFSLLILVTVPAYFFSKFIFGIIGHLQEENVSRLRELAVLTEIYQTTNEYQNLNALVNRVMSKLIQITSADSTELYLVDKQSDSLIHLLHSGLMVDTFSPEKQIQLKEGIIGAGTLLDQPVIIENLNDFQNSPVAFLADSGIRSLAIIPIKSRTNVVAVICLFSLKSDHFKRSEANLLLKIGNPIAVAIENAQLHDKVKAAAVLEERERISSELHDGLAQVLSYVITKSQATRQLLKKITLANDYLVELENVAQEVYTDTREAILGLRTAITGERSLVSALREYTVRFNQLHGIKTELKVGDHVIPSLSPRIELQAIRIVQEALSNVRKHAQATRATIFVDAGGDKVVIVVEDDGKGFDVGKVGYGDWTKFGLRNMKERVDSINGHLSVESSSENGTRITLNIPLNSYHTAIEEGKEFEGTNS